ncbi:hypothetical protein MKS88_003061 [Plasmodium brasilianum]|uniref:Uncharacterized protein n=2 Tax=Plasmodium (Plasmodium) TaxID=418103 RepID=A0A1A8W225_PLAMA|nr:hypothetical protein MKS88_003061 [Plasmodium brasilianum]SBS86003.1 conserved Plasmodium protein, unknown function [Plasmodium malariae]
MDELHNISLGKAYKNLNRTQNRSKEKSFFEDVNGRILHNNDTNEIIYKEINNVYVENINKNSEETNIKSISTNLKNVEMVEKSEETCKPLYINKSDKLTSDNAKKKFLFNRTKDETSCSSYGEGKSNNNDHDNDNVNIEYKIIKKNVSCAMNSTGYENINNKCNGKGNSTNPKLGVGNKSSEYQEEKQSQGQQKDHAPCNELENGDDTSNKNDSKIGKKMKYSKKNKKNSTNEIIKETTLMSVNNNKNLIMNSNMPTAHDVKLNDDNLKTSANKIINRGKLYSKKHKSKVNEKIIEEKLGVEKEENCLNQIINEEGKYKNKKNKRKKFTENVKNKYDVDPYENINRKKKKKNHNSLDDENVENAQKSSNKVNDKKVCTKNKKYNDNLVPKNGCETNKNGSSGRSYYETRSKEQVLKDDKKMNEVDNMNNKLKGEEMVMKKKNLYKKKDSASSRELPGNKNISIITNENDDGHVKKKYARLLKNLKTNLSSKVIEQEGEKRIKTWGDKITLQQKINYFIKNKIATRTEYKYGKKPNTLSICNQFNLYNHLTMLNDFNRLHYYRAAMRWTGHKDLCESYNNAMLSQENSNRNSYYVNSMSYTSKMKNSTKMNNRNCGENTVSVVNKENINNIGKTINIPSIREHSSSNVNSVNKINEPCIFFESNKECYVYNKNIIEIGTGPLSLLSINAILNGAKHVDALEVNKDASDMAKKLIEGYNLEDFIKIINCYSKLYVYREEDSQKRLKKRHSFYNFFDYDIDEQYSNNFNYDLIISEVIGDFASQEGVADIYLDLHKKIFSYRKYQEYLNNWGVYNGNNNGKNCGSNNMLVMDNLVKSKNNEKCGNNERVKISENNEKSLKMGKKISYREFAADEELYNTEEFYSMNIKSIPYSVTTYYCPVKFPHSDNIIYKSDNYPERTIISPQNKLLQSVMLEWSNLTLTEEENESSNFGKLEYLYLEQNVINQVIQKRSRIFKIQKNGPFCGFLITIDVEIRKGEHFGTKYGTCDSWYTNIVLLKDEINVEKSDLIINKTYANLLNYSENVIDRKTVLVSRPSYIFYGYILRLIKSSYSSSSSDTDTTNYNYDKKFSGTNDFSNIDNYIYLDDSTILLLDQMSFHEQMLSLDVNKHNDKKVLINNSLNLNNLECCPDNDIKIKKSDFTGDRSKMLYEKIRNSNEGQSKFDGKSLEEDCSEYANYDQNSLRSSCISRYVYSDVEADVHGNSYIREKKVETKLSNGTSKNENELINSRGTNKKLSNKLDYCKDKELEKNNNASTINKQRKKSKNTRGDKIDSVKLENNNSSNNINKNLGNVLKKKKKRSFVNEKKKKETQKSENKNKNMSSKSREEYENDISDITNNYNLNSKFYYENLKDKIIVYKNMKYKMLSFYEPVIIDYDEQATVIYKKDDIYNRKENNVNKFVNNVYQ